MANIMINVACRLFPNLSDMATDLSIFLQDRKQFSIYMENSDKDNSIIEKNLICIEGLDARIKKPWEEALYFDSGRRYFSDHTNSLGELEPYVLPQVLLQTNQEQKDAIREYRQLSEQKKDLEALKNIPYEKVNKIQKKIETLIKSLTSALEAKKTHVSYLDSIKKKEVVLEKCSRFTTYLDEEALSLDKNNNIDVSAKFYVIDFKGSKRAPAHSIAIKDIKDLFQTTENNRLYFYFDENNQIVEALEQKGSFSVDRLSVKEIFQTVSGIKDQEQFSFQQDPNTQSLKLALVKQNKENSLQRLPIEVLKLSKEITKFLLAKKKESSGSFSKESLKLERQFSMHVMKLLLYKTLIGEIDSVGSKVLENEIYPVLENFKVARSKSYERYSQSINYQQLEKYYKLIQFILKPQFEKAEQETYSSKLPKTSKMVRGKISLLRFNEMGNSISRWIKDVEEFEQNLKIHLEKNATKTDYGPFQQVLMTVIKDLKDIKTLFPKDCDDSKLIKSLSNVVNGYKKFELLSASLTFLASEWFSDKYPELKNIEKNGDTRNTCVKKFAQIGLLVKDLYKTLPQEDKVRTGLEGFMIRYHLLITKQNSGLEKMRPIKTY